MSYTRNSAVEPRSKSDLHDFLSTYREKLRQVFSVRADINKLGLKRGLPPFVMREIMSCTPLAVFIPQRSGGRGAKVHECLAMLEASSYESLALSLTMGISGALFLQPLSKYGHASVQEKVFRRFLEDKTLGGLMITEPDFGSDALRMQTSYVEEDGHYHVAGLKHWGGLTSWADFWLLTARSRDADGKLSRDIDFFVWDEAFGGIEVEELFENLGLYMIPYGRNRIDTRIPKAYRLEPHSTGIKMMLDILHRSRLQFPGMGMGFLKRMLDEAVSHCRSREIGGRNLIDYDQVDDRLTRLQASFTTCSAMCAYTSQMASVDNDCSKAGLPANAIKSVITDMMQSSAQSLLQLTGANGYRLDHIAGRSVVDSRSFQIFEGSNDILYQQITESVLKSMRGLKETNLHGYLSRFDFTSRAADYFKKSLNFSVDLKMPQRKLVDLGRVLGRIVSMELVIDLGERGFRSELVKNCLAVMRQDVESIISSYVHSEGTSVVENYEEDSFWLNFALPAPVAGD